MGYTVTIYREDVDFNDAYQWLEGYAEFGHDALYIGVAELREAVAQDMNEQDDWTEDLEEIWEYFRDMAHRAEDAGASAIELSC